MKQCLGYMIPHAKKAAAGWVLLPEKMASRLTNFLKRVMRPYALFPTEAVCLLKEWVMEREFP
jgi:hypothetical protein